MCQRFLADSEYGDIAKHLEVHATMQVIANIRYTIETNQVIFAIIDDWKYFMATCRRQAAIDLFYMVLL